MKRFKAIHEPSVHELSNTLTKMQEEGNWLPAVGNPIVYNDDDADGQQRFLLLVEQSYDRLILLIKDIVHESAAAAVDASFTVEGGGGTIGDGVITKAALLTAGIDWAPGDLIDIIDSGGTGSGAQIRVDTITGGPTGPIATWTLIQGGQDYTGPFSFVAGVGGFGSGATFDLTYDVLDSNTYEFSLDGIVFNSNNIFTGLGPGDYPVWIQDAEGNKGMGHVRIYTL